MKKELIVDMRTNDLFDTLPEMKRCNTLCYKINTTEPYTEEFRNLLKELFGNKIDDSVCIIAPIHVDLAQNVTIGKNVYINHDFDCMARGKVIIEDDVMIGPNVSVLTPNHDLLDHQILRCKEIVIKKSAWIGAKSIILPGVTIGENSVVGAGSVVTQDVLPYTVVVGNPARMIKKIEK